MMEKNTNKKADGVIGCGVIAAIVFAIVALVIQANVIHFIVIGGLIGMAVGWFGDTTAAESHQRENPRLNEHDRHESKHMLRDITEYGRSESTSDTVAKLSVRRSADTPNTAKTPSEPKPSTQNNERNQILGQLNEECDRRDQLLDESGCNISRRQDKQERGLSRHRRATRFCRFPHKTS